MNAAVISIGDELVLGQTVDTNAAWLSARLAERGILTKLHLTVADDRAAITDALNHAVDHAELILVTGGLGPTDDDLTRYALADALGCSLTLDEPSLQHIRDFFARRGRTMPERNQVQAMRPDDATALLNPYGTAPALRAGLGGAILFVLPGVPREMEGLFELYVLDELPAASAGPFLRTTMVNTFGVGESDISDLIAELTGRSANPTVGTTVSRGIVSVRIRAIADTAEEADRLREESAAEVERRCYPYAFSRDDVSLPEAVGKMLSERGATVVTAESCTAGLVGQMLTDPPGSSAYFVGGWMVYANAAKVRELGVSEVTLAEHGAVSEPVAIELAEHARQKADADYALAVTGIAGPSGGTEAKPVGTVYLALADRTRPTLVKHRYLSNDRATVRERSARWLLHLLRLRLIGEI